MSTVNNVVCSKTIKILRPDLHDTSFSLLVFNLKKILINLVVKRISPISKHLLVV